MESHSSNRTGQNFTTTVAFSGPGKHTAGLREIEGGGRERGGGGGGGERGGGEEERGGERGRERERENFTF